VDAPIAQHHCAAANEIGGIDVAHAQFFFLVRKHERANLKESELS
jgi:hypothetical protein